MAQKDLYDLLADVGWEASEDVVGSKVLHEVGVDVIESLFALEEAAVDLEEAAKNEPR